jgi:transcriptional regulator NrdR family protein
VVIESAHAEYGYRHRRRKCLSCGTRYNTLEIPAQAVEVTLQEDADDDTENPAA